ncbi:MAG: oligosaccharide flippase family protein [Bacteroidales bacterium]|nr:oligosaccharide flippase family protein [Bacteroidales bacterium]
MPKLSLKNEIVRNCTTLLSGTAVAQCITFLAYPFIARLYSSEDFGLYTTILSYIDILVILSTARYEQAIMVSKDPKEIAAIVKLCRRLCLGTTVLIAIAACAILALNKASKLDILILFIPLLVFFNGQYRIYLLLFNKYKEFKQIAFSDISTNLSGTVVKIALGLVGLFRTGLPIATVIGRIVGNINYHLRMQKIALPQPDKGTITAMIKKHRNFPLYSMPKDFINSFSANLPFTLLAIYFNEAYIGLFAMAFTFTFRPMNLINSAYERVLYERISSKHLNHEPIVKDIVRFFGYNYAVLTPLFVIAFVFARPILTFILGAEWAEAATYFRYMLPWIYTMLISSSISFIPNIFSTQRTEAIMYIALFVVRLAVLGLGIYANSFELSILLFCSTGTLFSIILTIWYFRLVATYDNQIQ